MVWMAEGFAIPMGVTVKREGFAFRKKPTAPWHRQSVKSAQPKSKHP
jgi:hypothetical protein